MPTYEYKVVPAPRRGLKARGVRGNEARFANALETTMNEMGAEGWEYLRADTLPADERQGLTGRTTVFQNMLVFRRVAALNAPVPEREPVLLEDLSSETPAEDQPGEDPRPALVESYDPRRITATMERREAAE